MVAFEYGLILASPGLIPLRHHATSNGDGLVPLRHRPIPGRNDFCYLFSFTILCRKQVASCLLHLHSQSIGAGVGLIPLSFGLLFFDEDFVHSHDQFP